MHHLLELLPTSQVTQAGLLCWASASVPEQPQKAFSFGFPGSPFPYAGKKHPSDGAHCSPKGRQQNLCPKTGGDSADLPCSASAPQQPCKTPLLHFMGATNGVAGCALPTVTESQRPCLHWPLQDPSDGEPGSFCPKKGPHQTQVGWGEAFQLVSWPAQLSPSCQSLLSGSLKQRGRETVTSQECLKLQAINPEGWQRSHVPESERRIVGRLGQPAGLAEPSCRCHTHKGRGAPDRVEQQGQWDREGCLPMP